MARITAADSGGFVIEAVHQRLQQRIDLTSFCHEFRLVLQQRKHATLDGCHAGVEAQDGAPLHLAVNVGFFFFAEGFGDDGQCHAVETSRWLDDVRDVVAFEQSLKPAANIGLRHRLALHFGLLSNKACLDQRFLLLIGEPGRCGLEVFIEDFHGLAAVLLVLRKVKLTACGDAFQFFRAERELTKNVHTSASVVGEVIR